MNMRRIGGWNRLGGSLVALTLAALVGCMQGHPHEGGIAAAGVPSTVHLVPPIAVNVDSEVEITVAWAAKETGDKSVEVTDVNGGNIVAQGPNQYGPSASKPAPYVNGIPAIVRFTIRPTGSTKLLIRVKNTAGAVQYTREFPVTTR